MLRSKELSGATSEVRTAAGSSVQCAQLEGEMDGKHLSIRLVAAVVDIRSETTTPRAPRLCTLAASSSVHYPTAHHMPLSRPANIRLVSTTRHLRPESGYKCLAHVQHCSKGLPTQPRAVDTSPREEELTSSRSKCSPRNINRRMHAHNTSTVCMHACTCHILSRLHILT